MSTTRPLQGEIWRVKLFPTNGREQSGVRPALVISGNAMNQNGDIVFACPLTSSIKDLFGVINIAKTKDNGLANDSQLLVFQMRALTVERFTKRLGVVEYTTINLVIDELSKLCRY